MDDDIKKQLDRIEMYARIGAKEVLNTDEVCQYTGLSKSRIYALCNQRAIPHYKQGKTYFKKKEVEQWLTRKRVTSMAEVEQQAERYCLLHQ